MNKLTDPQFREGKASARVRTFTTCTSLVQNYNIVGRTSEPSRLNSRHFDGYKSQQQFHAIRASYLDSVKDSQQSKYTKNPADVVKSDGDSSEQFAGDM